MKTKLARICLWIAVIVSAVSAVYFAMVWRQYVISVCFGAAACLLIPGGRNNKTQSIGRDKL